jgi:hypothetical protein
MTASRAVWAAAASEVDRTPREAAQATHTAPVKVTEPVGNHADWMMAAGISPDDFRYVDFVVRHESGWNPFARNSEGSGAYGLCQSLPAEKMASAGPDYLTNPVTQLRWCNSYALGRYGSWAGAYRFWLRARWW